MASQRLVLFWDRADGGLWLALTGLFFIYTAFSFFITEPCLARSAFYLDFAYPSAQPQHFYKEGSHREVFL